MEKNNCYNCIYLKGQCQNYNLSRAGKTKRKNGLPCEYWEEQTNHAEPNEQSLKAVLLDVAIQLEKIAYSLNEDEH